jgi:hypothetical protein
VTDKEELSRRGRNAKNKGKKWEKDVATLVAKSIGLPEEDVYNARSGRKECDINLSTEARRRFPFYLECKNEKAARVPAWIRQMEGDLKLARSKGKAFRFGMVVFKQDGDRTPYALVRFDHLLSIILQNGVEREVEHEADDSSRSAEAQCHPVSGGEESRIPSSILPPRTRRNPRHGGFQVKVPLGG